MMLHSKQSQFTFCPSLLFFHSTAPLPTLSDTISDAEWLWVLELVLPSALHHPLSAKALFCTILLPICAVLSFSRNNAVDFSLYPAFMRATGQATCHGKYRALNVARSSSSSPSSVQSRFVCAVLWMVPYHHVCAQAVVWKQTGLRANSR